MSATVTYRDLIIDVDKIGGEETLILEPRSRLALEQLSRGQLLRGFRTSELSFFDNFGPQGEVPIIVLVGASYCAIKKDHPFGEWVQEGVYAECIALIEDIRPAGQYIFLDDRLCSRKTMSMIDFGESSFDIVDIISWYDAPNHTVLARVDCPIDECGLEREQDPDALPETFVPVRLTLSSKDFPKIIFVDRHVYVAEREFTNLANSYPGGHEFPTTLKCSSAD